MQETSESINYHRVIDGAEVPYREIDENDSFKIIKKKEGKGTHGLQIFKNEKQLGHVKSLKLSISSEYLILSFIQSDRNDHMRNYFYSRRYEVKNAPISLDMTFEDLEIKGKLKNLKITNYKNQIKYIKKLIFSADIEIPTLQLEIKLALI